MKCWRSSNYCSSLLLRNRTHFFQKAVCTTGCGEFSLWNSVKFRLMSRHFQASASQTDSLRKVVIGPDFHLRGSMMNSWPGRNAVYDHESLSKAVTSPSPSPPCLWKNKIPELQWAAGEKGHFNQTSLSSLLYIYLSEWIQPPSQTLLHYSNWISLLQSQWSVYQQPVNC